MTITSPLYSFVKFNNDNGFTLPIVLDSPDTAFQFVFEGTISEADTMMTAPLDFKEVNITGVIDDDPSLLANTLAASSSFAVNKFRISATKVFVHISYVLSSITIPASECFRLAFKYDDIFYVSNGFKVISADKYTSIIEYSCDENNNGFYYCYAGLSNRVRLPLFLFRPQLNDEESVYVRSDGSIDILSSVSKKEYQGETDYFNQDNHEKLKIALSSDNISITSYYYTGEIRKNGGYEIDWPDRFEDETGNELGKAKFKVYATPYNVRNSNCDECAEEWAVPECIAFETTPGETSILVTWDVIPDIPLTISIYENSDGTGLISSEDVTGLGTHTFTGLNPLTTYYIRLQPNERLALCTLTTVATLTDCDAVGLPAYSMPDGTVGTDYTYSIVLTGDAPFVLSSIVKPSWMTISLTGSTVSFTGSPDTEGSGVTVSFTVSNCSDANTANFSDSINIAAAGIPPGADKNAYVVNDSGNLQQILSDGVAYPTTSTIGNFNVDISAGTNISLNYGSGSYTIELFTSMSDPAIYTATFVYVGDTIALSSDPNDASTGVNNINYIRIS